MPIRTREFFPQICPSVRGGAVLVLEPLNMTPARQKGRRAIAWRVMLRLLVIGLGGWLVLTASVLHGHRMPHAQADVVAHRTTVEGSRAESSSQGHRSPTQRLTDGRAQDIDTPLAEQYPHSTLYTTGQDGSWVLSELGWMENGTFHPVVTVGAGLLLFAAVSALVWLFFAIGGGARKVNRLRRTSEPETMDAGQTGAGGARRYDAA